MSEGIQQNTVHINRNNKALSSHHTVEKPPLMSRITYPCTLHTLHKKNEILELQGPINLSEVYSRLQVASKHFPGVHKFVAFDVKFRQCRIAGQRERGCMLALEPCSWAEEKVPGIYGNKLPGYRFRSNAHVQGYELRLKCWWLWWRRLWWWHFVWAYSVNILVHGWKSQTEAKEKR